MGDQSEHNNISDYLPDPLPRFTIGEAIHHWRYGYRGLVVDFDLRCLADDEWYLHHKVQPDRDQPWYHVLVDGSTAVTYAAEEHLELDDSEQPVHHPLVPHLFDYIQDGRYERNDTLWPGWHELNKPSDPEE